MIFAVVSERSNVKIFTRAIGPVRAQALAEQRRSEGASSVFVYDAQWSLVTASALAMMADQAQSAQTASPDRPPAPTAPAPDGAGARSQTFRVGASVSGEARDRPASASKGRVRIFRANSSPTE